MSRFNSVQKTMTSLFAATILAGLLIAGCAQATPAPAPTATPAAPKSAEPTKAAAPTTAPAAPTKAPTVAPTAPPKVIYPEKGKTITYISPYAPGGSDQIVRLMQPSLEKELGVPLSIVNKEGAGSQVGTTEIALAKPDGYTIGYTSIPTVNTIYLDPARKAAFSRKDLQPLTMHSIGYNMLVVKADSPFKSVKDFVDAAKANPGKITIASTGVGSITHMGILQFEQVAGIDLSIVQFNGSGPSVTALLGGHVDAFSTDLGNIASQVKGGQIRGLGIMAPERSKFAPDVPTFTEQGYPNTDSPNIRGFVMPAGAPREIIDTLVAAFKKSQADPQVIATLENQYYNLHYAPPEEFAKVWDEWDKKVGPLLELVKKDTQ